jgi:CheY-like chemotaxis protein
MPVMGGIEATAQIRDARSQVLNRDIPIVAMTANAMQSDRTMCLAAGMRRIEKMNQNRSPGCVPPPQIRAVLYLDKR